MVLLGFTYSTVNPIVLPFAVVFFGLGYLTYSYLALYVFVRPFEGGGLQLPELFHYVMTCKLDGRYVCSCASLISRLLLAVHLLAVHLLAVHLLAVHLLVCPSVILTAQGITISEVTLIAILAIKLALGPAVFMLPLLGVTIYMRHFISAVSTGCWAVTVEVGPSVWDLVCC